VVGSRQNKIVLASTADSTTPVHNGPYTIKTYTSEKAYDRDTGQWQHERIVLNPQTPNTTPL
jgi:hypothetical protein